MNHRKGTISVRKLGSLVALILLVSMPCTVWSESDQRRQGAEQKLRLVETLLNSPKTRLVQNGDNIEAKAQVAKAGQLVESARRALAASDLDRAVSDLDLSLRTLSAATSRVEKDGDNHNLSAQRARYAELLEQLRSYRGSLAEAARDARSAAGANAAIQKLDAAVAQAEKHATGGNYPNANKLLGEAYLAAVTSLSTLRSGETVLLSLKFDSAAEEYAYEEKRNQSHEMMVDMMIAEGKADGGKRASVERFLEEHRTLRVQAEKEAKAGNHASAIKTMEQATGQLIRALQFMGVPVF